MKRSLRRGAPLALRLVLPALVLANSGCLGTYDFDPEKPPKEARFPSPSPAGDDVDPFLSTHLRVELEGVSREAAFDAFLGLPVKDYFTGSDAFSPVATVEILTESWDAVGSRRRITLEDGNTAFETIFAKDRPAYFSFAIWEFSGSAGVAIGYVVGEWWFSEIEGGTRLEWRFNFRPRAWPSSWILEDTVKEDYLAYMSQIAAQFERTMEQAAQAKER